jgi:hypothetical protein
MNKSYLIKIIAYGLLQWVIFNLVLFVASLVIGIKEGAEMTVPPPLGFVVVAVVMTAAAYVFARQLKPTNQSQVMQASIIWTTMTIIFLGVTCIANGTQSAIFGNWGVYTVFAGQFVGPLLMKFKNPNVLPTANV